jgi:hypothetical protein
MQKYSDVDFNMKLEFLQDNIFVVGEQIFQQSNEIPMSTNCAPLFMTAYGNYISQLI